MNAIFSWDALWILLMILYIPSCIGLIIIVLLQKGKGTGFAGAFGVGAGSETVFGPRASKSLPQKLTYVMAGLFMLVALFAAMISDRVGQGMAPGVEEEGYSQLEQASGDYGVEGLGTQVQDDAETSATEPAAEGAATSPSTEEAAPETAPAPTEEAASEAVPASAEAAAPEEAAASDDATEKTAE